MRTILVLTAVAAGLVATPAMAKTGGLYVGALAGYEGIHVKSADGTATAKGDHAVYGVNAGYDVGLGHAFVGVEGEGPTASFTFRGQKMEEFPDLPPLETADVEASPSGEATPIEGPDDSEGPTDVPRAD